MRTAMIIADEMLPKKQPWRTCDCWKQPIDLTAKKGTVSWLVELGAEVTEGQSLAEGEVDKKSVDFTAPCSGKLVEICIEEDCVFKAGDVLGYIES